MQKILLACAALLAANHALAAMPPEMMLPINQFFDGLNKGDFDAALKSCASNTAIIDEFSPFLWQGPSACKDWLNDFGIFSKKNDLTFEKITLGKPTKPMIDGDHAYLVIPASFAFKIAGKHQVEKGSKVTATLTKAAEGWVVTGWSWTVK